MLEVLEKQPKYRGQVSCTESNLMGRKMATVLREELALAGKLGHSAFFANGWVQIINYFSVFLNSVEAREYLLGGLLLLQPWEPVGALPRGSTSEDEGQAPNIAWWMILRIRKYVVVLSTGI